MVEVEAGGGLLTSAISNARSLFDTCTHAHTHTHARAHACTHVHTQRQKAELLVSGGTEAPINLRRGCIINFTTGDLDVELHWVLRAKLNFYLLKANSAGTLSVSVSVWR